MRQLKVGVPGRTIIACVAVACVALVVLTVIGHWQMGAALAIGLTVGSLNGLMAKQAVSIALQGGAGFGLTSVFRILILTAVGLGLGFLLLGLAMVPFVIGGIALAQFLLAGVSAVEVSRV